MKMVESTLLGPAAGTDKIGRRLVAYQMQMPMTSKGPTTEVDNSRLTEISETLEIVYEGMYILLGFQKTPTPIDITITMTWIMNNRNSGVFDRYKRHPYLRVAYHKRHGMDERRIQAIVG